MRIDSGGRTLGTTSVSSDGLVSCSMDRAAPDSMAEALRALVETLGARGLHSFGSLVRDALSLIVPSVSETHRRLATGHDEARRGIVSDSCCRKHPQSVDSLTVDCSRTTPRISRGVGVNPRLKSTVTSAMAPSEPVKRITTRARRTFVRLSDEASSVNGHGELDRDSHGLASVRAVFREG